MRVDSDTDVVLSFPVVDHKQIICDDWRNEKRGKGRGRGKDR